ncbi:MAG: mechanosensitive ion channel family protein [Roseitalea sp.]|jgi:small-conductance mechanosensitive channel|nr:mechanosensitive ion channel family protein [Roseitalea sp.]MBO6741501.1 mechanosensitive ion channel family protein [Roseitalea sp.]
MNVLHNMAEMWNRRTPQAPAALLLLVAALLLALANPAWAQLPGLGSSSDSASESTNGYQNLIDQAREDGATVIVIAPNAEEDAAAQSGSMMPQTQLLQARKEFIALIARTPLVIEQSLAHFETLSPDGTYFWLWRAIGVGLLGIVVAFLVSRLIREWMRNHFADSFIENPETRAQKISYLMLRSTLIIVGNAISFAVAVVVAIILDSEHEPSRATIFAILSAYFIYRAIRYGFMLNLFAPDLPKHRLITLNDKSSRSLYTTWWCIVIVTVIQFVFAGWSEAVGMPLDAQHLLYIIAILSCGFMITGLTVVHRRAYGEILAGEGQDLQLDDRRRILELVAVILSIGYLAGASLLSIYRIVLGLPGDFAIILAPVVVTMIAVAAYGIAFIGIDWFYARRTRIFRKRYEEAVEQNRREEEARLAAMEKFRSEEMSENEDMQMSPPAAKVEPVFEYQPIFREFFERSTVGLIFTVSVGELARILGADMGREGGHPFAAFLDMLLIAYVAYQLLKATNRYIDEKIRQEGGTLDNETPEPGEGEGGVGQSRLATLLPIARNVLVAVVVVVAGTIALSNLGVDVAPLFAGAGVIGIAIGFGAQTLIRDVFSGAFFLLDDAFRKGEYVELTGVKGVVEKISIRSFQLRHHLGALHTIPFGEITSLTNYSRDWVMMKLPIRLTYGTDVERVRKLVKKLGQELLSHPDIGDSFLQPLKSQGVYKMEDSAMIVRVKFMTKPGEQFVARKIIYERIRQLFEQEGIPFANREVTVRLQDGPRAEDLNDQEKQAVSAAARRILDDEDAEKAAAAAVAQPGR